MVQIVEVTDPQNPRPLRPSRRAPRRRTYRRSAYRRFPMRRRRYYRRRTPRRSYRRPAEPSKFLRAQLDPFDDVVNGVKIPDSNTCPSSTITINDTVPMTADANGLCAKLFFPYMKNQWVDHVAGGVANWTWGAAFAGGNDSVRIGSVAGNYTLCRPVAHGVRLFCPLNSTDAKGFLHVCVVPFTAFGKTTWEGPTSISHMTNSLFYQRVPIANLTQQSLTVVNKFLDCTSQRYIDVSSNPAAQTAAGNEFQTPGWSTVVLVVEGATAATVPITVETVIHFEAIPLKSGLLTASPAAPYNLVDMTNVSKLAGAQPSAYLDAQKEQFFSRAWNHLYGMAQRHGPALYSAASNIAGAYGGIPGITNRLLGSANAGLLTM